MEAELLLFKSQCLASTHSCTNRRGDDKDEGRQIDQLKVCHGALLRLKKILFLTHGRGRREYVHVLPPAGSGTTLPSLPLESLRDTQDHIKVGRAHNPHGLVSRRRCGHIYIPPPPFLLFVCVHRLCVHCIGRCFPPYVGAPLYCISQEPARAAFGYILLPHYSSAV